MLFIFATVSVCHIICEYSWYQSNFELGYKIPLDAKLCQSINPAPLYSYQGDGRFSVGYRDENMMACNFGGITVFSIQSHDD